MWQQIRDDMNLMTLIIQGLLVVADEKDRLFIENNIVGTEVVFKREQELLSKLTSVENRYQSIVENMRKRYGMDETCSFVEIVMLLKPAQMKELLDLSSDMVGFSAQLKQRNERSRKVMNRAKSFIDFNINVLTQTVASDTYAPQGQEGIAFRKRKMFDQTI